MSDIAFVRYLVNHPTVTVGEARRFAPLPRRPVPIIVRPGKVSRRKVERTPKDRHQR